MQANKQLSKLFWGRHVWARGYFVATSNNITDEVMLDIYERSVTSFLSKFCLNLFSRFLVFVMIVSYMKIYPLEDGLCKCDDYRAIHQKDALREVFKSLFYHHTYKCRTIFS